MSDLLIKMNDYGADVKATMERFMNDEELYLACMQSFAEEAGFAALGEALSNKDYKAAFEQAHMLKGVSANLGLLPLYHAICNIVEPLRADKRDGLEPLYQAVCEEHSKYLKLIETL